MPQLGTAPLDGVFWVYLGATVLLLTAVGLLFRAGRSILRAGHVLENVLRIEDKTDELLKLVKSNGGNSVIDRMERVEKNVEPVPEIAAWIVELRARTHKLDSRTGAVESALKIIDKLVTGELGPAGGGVGGNG